jgi:ribosome assembly protein YihI (activator of Der GTPase)
MEALLEKEGKVENWNDDRLDELSRRMDAGFKEMREGFARVDAKFDRVDAKFNKLFIAIITVGGGFAATTIASLLGVLLL